MEEGRVRLFVGGGQAYYGDTASRDEIVVKRVAELLAQNMGDEVEVVTGGMLGIPDDFAAAYTSVGGASPDQVLCVVSSEHEAAFRARNLPYKCMVAGATQQARRLAVTTLPGLACALFVQGGKYSTHEMRLLQERGIPIVAFHGSGGAAGGGEPYEGWAYEIIPYGRTGPHLDSRNPKEDTELCALELVMHLMTHLVAARRSAEK
jgi:hypothetical protein